MQRRLLTLTLTLAMTSGLAMGCGSDDSSTPPAGGGKGGSSGSTSGNGGGGAATADGGGTGVPCGQTTCTPPAGTKAAVCCQDAFASTCGFKSGASCVDKAPLESSGCPSFNAMGITLTGCCVALQCGLDTTPFGGSCLELSLVKGQIPPGTDTGGAAIPEPQACP